MKLLVIVVISLVALGMWTSSPKMTGWNSNA